MTEAADSKPGRLTIDRLGVDIGGNRAVGDVSLVVNPGTIHCLVGDSGSGKTLTSLAAVGLLPRHAVATGSIRLSGVDGDLLSLDQTSWSSIRGRSIGYVGQNALGCLHPAFRVETQLVESIRRHRPMPRSEARLLALEELTSVDLDDPERVAHARPAELSGGMCQRVALAIAVCNRPSLLIADEPTTALDDDTQGHVLDLIRARVQRDGLGVLLITHDHRVVERIADEITTIADGVASQQGPRLPSATAVDRSTTAGLGSHDGPTDHGKEPVTHDDGPTANSTARGPTADSTAGGPTEDLAVLEITGVGKTYGRNRRRNRTPVLQDVTISAPPATTIGLVGRSGAGKTTLAQIVAGVLAPSEGSVRIGGRPITGKDRVGRLEKAGLVQYVFQDPFGSLNPRRTAVAQVAEPLIADGEPTEAARDRARELLRDVGLTTAQAERLPTALSGGQCQRVGIARALIRRPQVVVLDEPVSALDWTIRSDILAILDELQKTTEAMYLLISHERPLIERQSDRIYQVTDGRVRQL